MYPHLNGQRYLPRNEGSRIDISRASEDVPLNALKLAGMVFSNSYSPFVWLSGFIHKDAALDFKPYQKLNKIPMLDVICFKTTFFASLNEFRKCPFSI